MRILLLTAAVFIGFPLAVLVILFCIGSVVGPKAQSVATLPPAQIKEVAMSFEIPEDLRAHNVDDRQRAASRRGESANVADCEALLAALPGETDWTVRAAMVIGLGKQHVQSAAVREKETDRILTTLLPELKAAQPGLRLNAVRSLGWLKDARAVSFVLPLLEDNDENVRIEAISACGGLHDARVIPALLAIATQKSEKPGDGWLRIRAVNALGHLKDIRAVTPLLALLAEGVKGDAILHGSVLRALAEIGDTQSAPVMRDSLNDQDPNVRFDAICALARLRDTGALLKLQKMAQDDQANANGQPMNQVATRAIHFIQTGRGKVNEYE